MALRCEGRGLSGHGLFECPTEVLGSALAVPDSLSVAGGAGKHSRAVPVLGIRNEKEDRLTSLGEAREEGWRKEP